MNRTELTVHLQSPWRGPREDGSIVAPAVLLTPGTHCGSGGCVEYSAELLRETAARWNDTPITIHHPTDADGLPISVQNVPDEVIGHVRNARWEDNRLKADLVVTEERVRGLVQGISELSTGLFNEAQNGRATTIIADHVALLPDVQGACSWEDGCGVRANADPMVEAVQQFVAEHSRKAAQGLATLAGGNDPMKVSVSKHRSTLVEPHDRPAAHGQPDELLLPGGVDPNASGDEGPLMPTSVTQHQRETERQRRHDAQNGNGGSEPEPGGDEATDAPLMPTGLG